MSERDDLLNIFWEEMDDYLATLNQLLLKAEMTSGAELGDLLKELNRIAHSMKGAARAVGFSLVETIAHYMEEIFQHTRENGHGIAPNVADALYDGLDLIQNVMNRQENDADTLAQVINNLETIVLAQATPTAPPAEEPKRESNPPTEEVAAHIPTEETLRVSVRKLDQLMAEVSELLVVKMRGDLRYKRLNDLRQWVTRWQREWRSVRTAYIRLVRRINSIPYEWSEDLSTLIRFLETNQRYLAHAHRDLNQVYQMLSADQLALTSLTDTLQDHVSSLRMMPFETVFAALQRVTRDTARDLNKHAELVLVGGGVEIDKMVLDALKDPLLHLLRNALDHGIETPEARTAAQKPVLGHITIQAEGRGNELQIRITDDGQGVDLAKVRQKAVSADILTPAEADALDEVGVHALLFHSGFTTSDMVTPYSGRGLGMDIVKERVEALRGRISIASQRGQGTTLTINVPVSLTRIRCILFRVGGEEYAIPSIMVARMVLIPRDERFSARGQPMITLNNRPTAVTALGDLLDAPTPSTETENAHILVLQTNERTVALEVDDLYNEMELVLKPLGRELANAPFVAGAALLGSGEVVLVLDAHDLIRKASGDTLPRRRQRLMPTTSTPRRIHVLIVDDSITTRTLEKNILEAAGFLVSVATDGTEAWAILQEDTLPDIVISDVEMPKMNGLDLTHRIKGDGRTRDLPVVLLTSLSKPEQREAGLRVGADAYLVKSRFDQDELLKTIHSVLVNRF